jgi:hypothetical protein
LQLAQRSAISSGRFCRGIDAISTRQGKFLPAGFSWLLSAECTPHILFTDGPEALTARGMIDAALQRQVRSLVRTTFGIWCRRSFSGLAAATFTTQLAARCVGTGRGPFRSLVDHWDQRALKPLIASGPLQLAPAVDPTRRARVVIFRLTFVAGGAERQIVNTKIGLREA